MDLWPRLLQATGDRPQWTETQDALILHNVSFRQLYELGFRLQTIRDLYWQVADATVKSISELKKFLERIHWDWILPSEQRYQCQVEVRSYASRLYHESSLRQIICEHLQAQGFAASSQLDGQVTALRLRFHWKDNRLFFLLALTDRPHYQRGLRRSFQVKAPLAEHFAAALIHWYAAGLQQRQMAIPSQIYVPFAGSGTLGWEYLVWYYRLPPSLLQENWISEHWPCAPQATISYLRQHLQLDAERRASADLRLRFCEKNKQQVDELQQNLKTYGSAMQSSARWQAVWQASDIGVFAGDFFADELATWLQQRSLAVLVNPPYGLRLGDEANSSQLYARLGERLKSWASQGISLSGVILVANDACFHALQAKLANALGDVMSFNQGGKHVRALQFFLA